MHVHQRSSPHTFVFVHRQSASYSRCTRFRLRLACRSEESLRRDEDFAAECQRIFQLAEGLASEHENVHAVIHECVNADPNTQCLY